MKSYRIFLKDGRAITVKATRFVNDATAPERLRFYTGDEKNGEDRDFYVPVKEVSVVVPVESLVEESAKAFIA